jgi:hypothetical protein
MAEESIVTYAAFDEQGFLVSFWTPDQGGQPPMGYIQITEEQFTALATNPHALRLVSGTLSEYVVAPRQNGFYVGCNGDGIVSGFWQSLAYPEGTAVPDGYIQITEEQFEDLFSNQGTRRLVGGQVVVYDPPAPEPGPYRISKTTPWLRMTDAEAASVESAMTSFAAKQRQYYAAATYLSSDDPLWPDLQRMLGGLFGVSRSSQILAPEA